MQDDSSFSLYEEISANIDYMTACLSLCSHYIYSQCLGFVYTVI